MAEEQPIHPAREPAISKQSETGEIGESEMTFDVYNPSKLSLAEKQPPGWNKQHELIPHPTYWPAVMALAITLFGLGIATAILISFVGLILFIIALVGWLGDIKHARAEETAAGLHGHTQHEHR